MAALMITASATTFAEGIEWSGFGSLYYSQAFDNQFYSTGYTDNHSNFTRDSLIGVNLGTQISDDMTFGSQWIAAGTSAQSENFNLFAQWAFLNWRLNDSTTMKVGRQLWPVLIASEYQRVRYLLPAVSIPTTAYALVPFVSFDGVSVNKDLSVGDAKLTLGAYHGSPKLNTTLAAGNSFDFVNLTGVRATLDGSGWRLHATANQMRAKLTITVPSASTTTGQISNTIFKTENNANVFSAGFRFDKYNFVTWGEMSMLKGKDDTKLAAALGGKKFAEKSSGGYVLVGYRFDKLMPYVTAAQGSAFYGVPTSSGVSYQGKVKSYTVGSSYRLNDAASFKVEVQQDRVPSKGGGFYSVVQQTASTKTHAESVRAGIDFIF